MTEPRKHKVEVSEDGYLLQKVFHKNTVQRFIDWKALGITEAEIREQSKLKYGPIKNGRFVDQRKLPTTDEEMDRFCVIELCMPYNPPPDDLDEFFYYNDIGALSGSAGYIRIRDGYVWGTRRTILS